MKIEHIALWSKDLEKSKEFYMTYFNASANVAYHNPDNHFKSHFLSFPDGCRLEIMHKTDYEYPDQAPEEQFTGYSHMAFSVGNKTSVLELTEKLRAAGYQIASEPRTTGDGYFESCVLDPDGNRVEITVEGF